MTVVSVANGHLGQKYSVAAKGLCDGKEVLVTQRGNDGAREAELIGQKPWVGAAYQQGVQGQKLLLIGYAHRGRYGDSAHDPEYTRRFFTDRVLTGTTPTFAVISDAFGEDRRQFWQKVAFAQISPSVLLEEDERFALEWQEELKIEARFDALLAELRPDKLIVLSQRAWEVMPRHSGLLFDEELFSDEPDRVRFGSYRAPDGGEVLGYRLPHARFANPDRLRASIAATLEHVPPNRSSQARLYIEGGYAIQQHRGTDARTAKYHEQESAAEAYRAGWLESDDEDKPDSQKDQE